MKMSEPRRITYPTGLKVERVDCRSADGLISLHVEEYLNRPRGALLNVKPGTVELTGAILTDPSSPIGFESMDVRTFSGPNPDQNWDRALRLARKMCG